MQQTQKSNGKREKNCADDNDKDNAKDNLKYRLIINLEPYEKMSFLNHHMDRYRLPAIFSKSFPQRNKNFLQYKMNRSLNFDITDSKKDNSCRQSPNSSLDSDCNVKISHRDLSRSAKIMRALNSFRRDESIKKSLNFDSSPSPKKKSSFEESALTDTDSTINTPSPIMDKVLSPATGKFLRLDTSSTDSSIDSVLIASSESIDENQNQTPQHNRKFAKISNDTKKNADKSGSSGSTSCLRTRLKEEIDKIVQMSHSQSMQLGNRSRTFSCDTNTIRNLLPEFNKDEKRDRPHTPKNVFLIPESTIKTSHKKERSHYTEEQASTQQMDVVKNENSYTKTTMESLGMDNTNDNMSTSGSYNVTFVDRTRKKDASMKETLLHNLNNELSDGASIVDEVIERENTPEDIDSSDCKMYEENTRDSDSISPLVPNHNDKEENYSDKNACSKERCQPLASASLRENISSIDIFNVNVTEQGNRERSLESDAPVSQEDFNRAVTPENPINIIRYILTESIKKSHKKIKQENKKAPFKPKILSREAKVAEPEMSVQVTRDSNGDDNRCEDIKSKPTDAICVSTLQNSDRPNTPENINSSRLLLSQFSSVKKSHKKDKRNNSKRILDFTKCPDEHRENCEKDIDRSTLEMWDKHGKENTGRSLLRGNESPRLKEMSFEVFPSKRKKTTSMSVQSDSRKLLQSPSSGCDNTDDEFKMHTPIRRRRRRMSSIVTAIANCVHADETSLKKDESAARVASKQIDYSRCATPVTCYVRLSNIKQKRSESFMRGERTDATEKIENVDARIVPDTEPADTAAVSISTDKNGRSTPINMSTMELLCNIDSIKKSHKKDKHSCSVRRRRISKNKRSEYTEETGDTSSASNRKIPRECTTSFLQLNANDDGNRIETGARDDDERNEDDKGYDKVTIYDDSKPSTSRKHDSGNERNIDKSKPINATPPNSQNTVNFIKLLRTTSIKKSHKKERNRNAQAKYILMSEEHDLSDDGSIFDEEDRLISIDSFSPCQDSDNEKIYHS